MQWKIIPYSVVYLRIQQWKNNWNRSTFAKILVKIKVAPMFMVHGVVYKMIFILLLLLLLLMIMLMIMIMIMIMMMVGWRREGRHKPGSQAVHRRDRQRSGVTSTHLTSTTSQTQVWSPSSLSSSYNLRKRRYNLTLPEKKGHLHVAAKTLLSDCCTKTPTDFQWSRHSHNQTFFLVF